MDAGTLKFLTFNILSGTLIKWIFLRSVEVPLNKILLYSNQANVKLLNYLNKKNICHAMHAYFLMI